MLKHFYSLIACALFASYSASGQPLFSSFSDARGGSIATIDIPHATSTEVLGINNSGTLVGVYFLNSGAKVFSFIRDAEGNYTKIRVGSKTTALDSINDSGVSTGTYTASSGAVRGLVRSATGVITTFRVQNAVSTNPTYINANGVVTGFYTDKEGANHGFIRETSGAITTFDVPGAGSAQSQGTVPEAINTKGVVAGYYSTSSAVVHAFIRAKNGDITKFDVGSGGTQAFAINDAGTVVGNDPKTAFIRTADGTITKFNPPRGHHAIAYSINKAGDTAGVYIHGRVGPNDGFIRAGDGTFVSVQAANTSLLPLSLNNKGVMVGIATVDGKISGFEWTPPR